MNKEASKNSVTPERPGTPVTPELSGTPATPALSGTPATPALSGTPVTPERPGTSYSPALSSTPATPERPATPELLECERFRVYMLLIFAAGMFGAFTYTIRGGIFCNAQTGNCVLMGIAIAEGNWPRVLYLFIPMSAYILGAVVSELLPDAVNEREILRWDTFLVGFEILVVIGLGFIPESAPVQLTQVIINFTASMQYNTFRQARHEAMSTTFCTNHFRQLGVGIVKTMRHGFRRDDLDHILMHLIMLLMFIAGVSLSAFLCFRLLGRAIWASAVPLGIVFIELLHADLTKERGMFARKPGGH